MFSRLGLAVIDEQHKFGVEQVGGCPGLASVERYSPNAIPTQPASLLQVPFRRAGRRARVLETTHHHHHRTPEQTPTGSRRRIPARKALTEQCVWHACVVFVLVTLRWHAHVYCSQRGHCPQTIRCCPPWRGLAHGVVHSRLTRVQRGENMATAMKCEIRHMNYDV